MVRIYKEQFGRGPERARSHYAGSDTIICLLHDSLTPVEHSMHAMGEDARLRDIRMMFQYATEDRFRAAVEEVTGRRVVSFMSGVDINNDVACEVFTLEPRLAT
ncbi:MAG TPA: Na-translocating system protein MpsC family protein [Gaiellales bacterium]|nr:Na-translocating system protein MpsC family protein [Gaiellales bacterium]